MTLLDEPATTESAEIRLPSGCTFDASDWAILAMHWYPIARVDDVGVAPLAATLLDQSLVIYRAGDEFVVADDICPHRGVPLSAGTGDGSGVQCAYHGLRFGSGGACVAIPADPSAKIPDRMNLRPYPVAVKYGLIWTCLRPSAADRADPSSALPLMPGWDQPGYQQVTCPAFEVKAFAGRQLEGFIDVAHFAYVHTGTFGDPDNSEVPPYTPEATDNGFIADYWSTVGNYPHGGKIGEEGFLWLRRFETHLPFTATLIVHFPDGGRLCIMNAASPTSARVTRMFAPIAKNFDIEQDPQDIFDFNLRIFEEDRRIVEIQKPENLPLDPRLEVNIAADRSSVAYRRGLRAMGLSHFFTA